MVHVVKQKKNSFDLLLAFSTIALLIIGLIFIYSSGLSPDGSVNTSRFIRQLLWSVSGIFLAVFVYLIPLRMLRSSAVPIYIVCLVLLLLTIFFGRVVNGARSWLGIGEIGVQPSEFAKIATIIFLAAFSLRQGEQRIQFSSVLLFLAAGLAPTVLVLLQPDLGTAIVFPPIIFAMLFIAHIPLRYLLFLALTAFISIGLIFIAGWDNYAESNTPFILTEILQSKDLLNFCMATLAGVILLSAFGYYIIHHSALYWISYFSIILAASLGLSAGAVRVFKPYQMMRLISYIDPYIDPQGAGWHTIQSITAVGSGGLFGKGYLLGTQSQYNFLPEKSTDFIFSLLAEEWGFAGSLITLLLYLLIVLRGMMIVYRSRNLYIQLLCTGIVTMLSLHIFVNIGMTIGIMPVTGIPLFFLSAGGSSLWTGLVGIAILLRAYRQRFDHIGG